MDIYDDSDVNSLQQTPVFSIGSNRDQINSPDLPAYEYLLAVKADAETIEFQPSTKVYESISNVTTSPTTIAYWQDQIYSDFLDVKYEIDKQRDASNPTYDINATSHWQKPKSLSSWRSHIYENPPPPINQLRILTQGDCMKLITAMSRWLSPSVSENFCKWVLVVLLSLGDILDFQDMSMLRGLAKKALKILTWQVSTSIEYIGNLIVLVIGYYHRQLDLIDQLITERRSPL